MCLHLLGLSLARHAKLRKAGRGSVAGAVVARLRRVALLSIIFGLAAKQLGKLAQAIFGWSVTALFGQLPSAKRTALSVAILLSLVWPVLVVGLFAPAVAAWSIAAVPLHKWVGEGVIRVATIALVVILPLAVGLITRWVAPARTRKGGTLHMMLSGYPLTVGYATSCLVTAVTVPIIKVGSLFRRWVDEHVFVQPREGAYELAMNDLEAACRAAGVVAVRQPVPRAMSISTRVVRWFARGALDAIVEADPQMLKATNVELYLYPADLLLRGEPKVTARVRARMAASPLERHAFLVASPDAQRLEDELQRMGDVVDRHHSPAEIGGLARERLREIEHDLDTTYVPYDEWMTLDRSLRRLREELEEPEGMEDAPMKYPTTSRALEETPLTGAPTAELIKEVIGDAQDLLKIEVALAKTELREEVAAAKTSGVAFGAAAAGVVLGLAMLLVALVFAIAPTPLTACLVGGVLLVAAGAAVGVGYARLPKDLLGKTRQRLRTDVKQLKEHVA